MWLILFSPFFPLAQEQFRQQLLRTPTLGWAGSWETSQMRLAVLGSEWEMLI